MADLSAHARRVLALARDADAPASEVQERVERALSARIAGGALPNAAPLASSSAPLAAKALLPVGLALTIAGAGWFGLRPQGPSETAPAHLSAAAPPATVVPQVVAPSPPLESPLSDETSSPPPIARAPATAARERATPKPAVRSSASQPMSPPSPPRVDARAESPSQEPPTPSSTRAIAAESSPAPAPAPTSRPAPDPLLAETEALRQAQRALRSGDAAQALELLAIQDRTFATGSLQQERAAARVLSLCQSGRAQQARTLAARFIERWPRSALRARVTAACRAPE